MKGMETVRECDDYPAVALAKLQEDVVRAIHEGDKRFEGVVAESVLMQQLYAFSTLYAGNHCPVFIGGPSGSGKEIVAKTLHRLSPRFGQPFVPVNCANLPDSLLESELFGYEKGAFTDARQRKVGLVAVARDGTLFLDEIACMSPSVQAKVLRFLQFGEYRPLGSNETFCSQARIVVATNASLLDMVRARTFREDLYYRLNAFPLNVPPLSRRKEDIPHLARHFLTTLSPDFPNSPTHFSDDALHYLQTLPWEEFNNVRGLKNLIRRLCALGKDFCPQGVIDVRMIEYVINLDPKVPLESTKPPSIPVEEVSADQFRIFVSLFRSLLADVVGQKPSEPLLPRVSHADFPPVSPFENVDSELERIFSPALTEIQSILQNLSSYFVFIIKSSRFFGVLPIAPLLDLFRSEVIKFLIQYRQSQSLIPPKRRRSFDLVSYVHSKTLCNRLHQRDVFSELDREGSLSQFSQSQTDSFSHNIRQFFCKAGQCLGQKLSQSDHGIRLWEAHLLLKKSIIVSLTQEGYAPQQISDMLLIPRPTLYSALRSQGKDADFSKKNLLFHL